MILYELHPGAISPDAIPIIFGLIIAVMVYTLGNISGAHFNPAVSVAFYQNKTISIQELSAYIPTQVIAAIGASLAHKFLFGNDHSFGMTINRLTSYQGISFEILIDPIYLVVLDMQLCFNDYIDDSTNDNIGQINYSEEGKISIVFLVGNNINGKIFSFTVQGINFGTTDVELNSVNSVQYIDGEIEENYSSISLENVNLIISE